MKFIYNSNGYIMQFNWKKDIFKSIIISIVSTVIIFFMIYLFEKIPYEIDESNTEKSIQKIVINDGTYEVKTERKKYNKNLYFRVSNNMEGNGNRYYYGDRFRVDIAPSGNSINDFLSISYKPKKFRFKNRQFYIDKTRYNEIFIFTEIENQNFVLGIIITFLDGVKH